MLSAKPWNPKGTFILCMVIISFYCLLSIAGGMILQMNGNPEFDRGSIAYLLVATLSLPGAILLTTGFYLRSRGIRWSEAFGFGSPGKVVAVLWGISAGLVFVPVGNLVRDLCARALGLFHVNTEVPQQAVQLLNQQHDIFNRICGAVFAIVLAPVAEEVLFRGILYPAIKQAGFPRTAVWATSILFAAIHFDLVIFIPLAILAMILICLYEKTNNLLAPIVAHSLFNTAGIVYLYFGEDISRFFSKFFQHHT